MKMSNIGSVFVAQISNIIGGSSFTGIPLLIMVFFLNMLGSILLPSAVARWTIMAGSVVPVFMNVGLTPELAQLTVRFSEGMAMGLTPLMAYYVIYLAYIEKYNQGEEPVSLFTTLKYQLPFSIIIGLTLLALLIIWYISGLPIGINGGISL
jgi:aminobenzoyl-glutamate transport protein